MFFRVPMRRFSFPSLLLLVALLFQAATAGAAMVAVSSAVSGSAVQNCARDGSTEHQPAGVAHGHHCLACLLCDSLSFVSPDNRSGFLFVARDAIHIDALFSTNKVSASPPANAHRARAPPSFLL
jgi:hypothetical protein